MEEVVKHRTNEDCWTVIDGLVYDITKYIGIHPGGKKIMLGAGKEASDIFRKSKLFSFLLYLPYQYTDKRHAGLDIKTTPV